MKTRIYLLAFILNISYLSIAQTVVHISDPQTWTRNSLSQYVGQTVTFDVPFYICNNNNYKSHKGALTISTRRLYTPTNQTIPGSDEYQQLIADNSSAMVYLSGINDYHRNGEMILGLTAYVNSASELTASGTQTFSGNTRADMEKGFPSVDVAGEHSLLVCGFNLEYYLVENLGTGYGPDDQAEHNKQKVKIKDALSHIKADVFGFVEIEQGQAALKELADILTEVTGKKYSYIDDGGTANGSYTKSGYVYNTTTVEPYGGLKNNNTGVQARKKMQAFKEVATNEIFIYSINHFKAKAGSNSATGSNKDQGDGQGAYNASRVAEAVSVINNYEKDKSYFHDDDILIMGDLNAYGMEDPIRTFTDAGYYDLHRYFHADTAYSYYYGGLAGYLDHAIANQSLLSQITGVEAYHINSDESDSYTYDKSNDLTMFRCSDHDPVIVGLKLGAQFDINDGPVIDNSNSYSKAQLLYLENQYVITHAKGGYYRIYNLNGLVMSEGVVTDEFYQIDEHLPQGFYVVDIYVENKVKQIKIIAL